MLRYLLRLKGVTSPGGLNALCNELLEQVNLTFAARRKVKPYSEGMRQRLGIAQAIADDPRLIIVDEPTAGLDPEERQRFYRLLSELAEERIVLLSTHIVFVGNDGNPSGFDLRRLACCPDRARRACVESRPLPLRPLDPAADPGPEPGPGRPSRHAAACHLRQLRRHRDDSTDDMCLLLLWYTVDSLDRERSTRLVEIAHAAPTRTGSLLLGKAVALAAAGLAIIIAAGLGGVIAILIQSRVLLEFRPFVLVCGLLLVPTFLVWTCFVIAVHTITRNR